MELEVVKVEEGMCSGRVLYHSFIQRSAAEAAAQQKDIDERERLRAERRRQQVKLCSRFLVITLGHAGHHGHIEVSGHQDMSLVTGHESDMLHRHEACEK